MSNPLAIGATMHVIAGMLDESISQAQLNIFSGAPNTTVQAPDRIEIGANEKPHLNLFLYTVTMNAGWRNTATVRSPSGERTARPPLAVDLHFLLSAYGATEYHPELLLGIGMQALYEQPFLDRKSISNFFSQPGSVEHKAMATSELDLQIEQIKIAPHDLSADELYKLWSAFGSKCRPSAAYVATVVLINSKGPTKTSPRVRHRNLGVVVFERPLIEDVTPDLFELNGPMQLKLSGSGFQTPGLIAQFGTTQTLLQSATPDFALVTVPNSVVPGMNLLKLVRKYEIGEPPPPDKLIADSNPVGIIVLPRITGVVPAMISGVQRVVVDFTPNCAPDQQASLLLDQLDAAPGKFPNRYAIDAKPSDISAGSIAFDAGTVASGNYLVRLSIDGAESLPTLDPNQGFVAPKVQL